MWSFFIIQIKRAGKDHRRLSCFHCVSPILNVRNWDGNSAETFFFCPLNCISVPTSVDVLWENAVSVKCHICMGETECGGGWGGKAVGIWRLLYFNLNLWSYVGFTLRDKTGADCGFWFNSKQEELFNFFYYIIILYSFIIKTCFQVFLWTHHNRVNNISFTTHFYWTDSIILKLSTSYNL